MTWVQLKSRDDADPKNLVFGSDYMEKKKLILVDIQVGSNKDDCQENSHDK